MTEGRPTIEDLNTNIGGIKNLIEDRNKLMNFMFKEDRYNDFLLAEKLQSMGDVGGLKVQPISGRGMDLSPINDLLPNTIEHDVAGKIDPKIVRMPRNQTNRKDTARNPSSKRNWTQNLNPMNWFGNNNNNKTKKLAKGGFIPSLSGFSPKGTSVKSLEQSGFDDTFQKNISSKLEDDFAIPDSLKRAFGEAMELPLRASAAMISDLISKIPAQDSNTKSIINESLSEVANAFHLSKTNLTNEVSSSDSSETTGGNSFVNSLSNVVSSTSSIQIADASRGRKNLNLLNPFDWPQILEEGGKARSGTRTNTEGNKLSVPTNILNRNNTLQQMINEISSTGSTSDMMNNIQSVAQNFSSDNLTASLPGMTNIISSAKSGDQSLTQLTEMVINATHKNQLENVESIKAKALATVPQLPVPKPIATANQGSADSISKVKESPFFELYTAMSQFS